MDEVCGLFRLVLLVCFRWLGVKVLTTVGRLNFESQSEGKGREVDVKEKEVWRRRSGRGGYK